MKQLAWMLLGIAATVAASAAADSATTTTAPADAAAAPALSDDETLAQQLVYCAVVAQKLGGKAQKTGWSASYGASAVALTSAAFVATQTLAQAGATDGLSDADLQNASAQCQQTMLLNTARIAAAMQRSQAGQ